MDLRQSPAYARYLKLRGWQVEKTIGCQIFIRKISLTPFSIIKVQRPEKIPLKKINYLAKKYRALIIYLEPLTINHQPQTTQWGYHLSKSPFLPTKTIQIDLTQSLKKILGQMKKDARYGIRKAKTPLGCTNVRAFHWAWKKAVGWQHYVPSLRSIQSLKKAFGKKAFFLTIHSNGLPIAGTVILLADKTAYYYYAFTSKEGRKKLAQYLLVWEAIKLAKYLGCKIFDLEGVYDERFPIKSWQGFSHFKKSFGGKEIEYPGCYIISASQRRRYSQ